MNKFLLVKAANRGLFESLKKNLREHALASLPYRPDRIRVRLWPESNVLFAQFEASNSAGFNKHYVATKNSHTFAFDGLPYWATLDLESNWAEQLDALWRSDSQALNNVFGTWAFARFGFGDGGGRVLTDFTGMTPLFYWSDVSYLGISPRQSLLARSCGGGDIDVEALAWLTGQANIIGDKAVWRGVRHLPPQWTLEFNDREGDLSFVTHKREIWTHRDQLHPSIHCVDFDALAHALSTQCDALSKLPISNISIDITGGLDSRLVAAIASESNLAARIKCLQTSGHDDSPDVVVGAEVANALGFPHVVNTPARANQSAASIRQRMLEGVTRFEASICASDSLVSQATSSRVIFTGSAGEIYRRHCKPHMNVSIRNLVELDEAYQGYHQKTDPLGIQVAATTELQSRTLRELARGLHDDGAEFNDISDIFFMRYRLPLWNGIMMNNIFGGVRIYPLVSIGVAREAFKTGYGSRISDRIHFELLLRIAPQLLALPFYGKVWPAEFREHAASRGIDVSSIALAPPAADKLRKTYNWLDVLKDNVWDFVDEMVLPHRESDLWAIIDREKLGSLALERKALTSITQIKQVAALIGMQAALCDFGILAQDGALQADIKLDGHGAQILFGSC